MFALTRIAPILQTADTDCGIACIEMVLHFFGRSLDESLEAVTAGRSSGTSAFDLKQIAIANGLGCDGIEVATVTQLRQLPLPAILHWDNRHFVVLERVTANWCDIIDPAQGYRRIATPQVFNGFSGVALTFSDPQEGRSFRSTTLYRSAARRLGRVEARDVLVLTALGLAVVGSSVAVRAAVQRLVTEVAPSAVALGILVGLAVGSVGLRVLSKPARHALPAARRAAVAAPSPAGEAERDETRAIRPESGDLRTLPLLTGQPGSLLLVVVLYGASVLLLGLDYTLGTAAIALVGVLALLRARTLRIGNALAASADAAQWRLHEEMNIESLHAKLASAARTHDESARRLAVLQNRCTTTLADDETFRLRSAALAFALTAGGSCILLLLNAERNPAYAATPVGIVVWMLAFGVLDRAAARLQRGATPIRQSDQTPARTSSVSLADTVQDIAQRFTGAIELIDVGVAQHEGHSATVRHISFRLDAGLLAVISGSSGAGSSTLARVIAGWVHPSEGVIHYMVDGEPVSDARHVRSRISYVGAWPRLVDASLRDNIARRGDAVGQAQIDWATEVAGLDATIAHLSLGTATPVGEHTPWMTDAVRQCVGLARALMYRPRLLVLDRATALLDESAEITLYRRLSREGITVVTVSDRPGITSLANVHVTLHA